MTSSLIIDVADDPTPRLNALNCAGEQVVGHCAPDAKQYKLGAALTLDKETP